MSDGGRQALDLLEAHGGVLRALVRAEAKGLLRFESEEDLLQGIRQRVLETVADFEDRGPQAAAGWLRTVARSWLSRRRAYWSALKRDGGAMLRFTGTWSGGATEGAAPLPAGTLTGPATRADRREQLTLAVRALDLLLDRDRELVRLSCQGLSTAEIAGRLELSPEAAARARLRAIERLRKAYQLVSRA